MMMVALRICVIFMVSTSVLNHGKVWTYSTVNRCVVKISEFEKVSGLSRDTLRYYEKIGVLTPPTRSLNGYRGYGAKQLEEIAFIQKGKKICFSLLTIKHAHERFKLLGHFCSDFTEQLERKKTELQANIAKDKLAVVEIDKMLQRDAASSRHNK